jgi:hypothetical protein
MRSSEVFCPQMACPARGQRGQGNIWVHSRQPVRYKCTVCGKTFSARGDALLWSAHGGGDDHAGGDAGRPRLSDPGGGSSL